MPEPCRHDVADFRACVGGRLAADGREDLRGPAPLELVGPLERLFGDVADQRDGRPAHAGLQQRRTERGDVHDGDLVVSVDGGDERPRPVTQRDVGEADRDVPAFGAARLATRVEDLLDALTAGEQGLLGERYAPAAVVVAVEQLRQLLGEVDGELRRQLRRCIQPDAHRSHTVVGARRRSIQDRS